MHLLINIDRNAKRPLQVQLYEAIRNMIVNGTLKAGQRLPSTRSVSHELGIARNTVVLAYDRLVAEDYISSRLKAGIFVNKRLPDASVSVKNGSFFKLTSGQRIRLGRNPSFSGTPFQLWKDRASRPLHDFFVGRPHPDSFPTQFWQRSVARHIAYAHGIQTEYGDPRGLLRLRTAIAEHLKATRGLNADHEQIIITSGIQGALNLLSRLFISGRAQTSVAIENPCYQGAAFLFASYGAKMRPIQVDEQGLIVDQLNAFQGNLVYVTPSHQFPTGYTLSVERRLQLLDWASRTGSYVIEDDYDSDFRYDGPPLRALAGMDRKERVIYLGTFSKSIAAGIRIGYAVLPRHLLDIAGIAKALLDLGPPWLEQSVIADFVEEGAFERHLKRIRRSYMSKRDLVVNLIDMMFPGGTLSGEDCGMHMMWRTPDSLPSPDHIQRVAMSCGIGLYPLAAAGAHEYGIRKMFSTRAIVLGYAALSESAIQESFELLAANIFS